MPHEQQRDCVCFLLNYLSFFLKAIEDEGGDPENIQVQPPTDTPTRKGGKAKGKLAFDFNCSDGSLSKFSFLFFQRLFISLCREKSGFRCRHHRGRRCVFQGDCGTDFCGSCECGLKKTLK